MNPVDLLSVNDGMHSAVNVQKEPVIPAVGQVEKNTGRDTNRATPVEEKGT
jgi:hypothetical protein